MSDFLLELRSEEIPARMQAGARSELERLFRREIDAAGVSVGEITVWSTPRRLALIAGDLPDATEAVSEEAKGPPEGAPDQAVEGFCRKNGVTRDQLEVRDIKGRPTYFAVKDIPGRRTHDLLAEAIPAIIRDFSWPKSMRWGAASMSTESLRWVRPLSGILALLGDDVVECEVHGVTSGAVTLGHRFHHSGNITIGNAGDYAMKLRAGHVIVDHEERQDLIRTGAAKIASEAGLELVEDEGLVVENAGLTEWPVPLLGRFEEDFLTVPPEVIQLTARVNQKYFVCTSPLPLAGGVGGPGSEPPLDSSPTPNPSRTREGNALAPQLANAFICTANIEAEDGGARVVDGNRKVLAARLADARFFWDVDRKKTLAEHAEGLERITFHEKLGTVADKVERVAKLARWLVEEGIVTAPPSPREGGDLSQPSAKLNEVPAFAGTREELATLAEQAARLCKADLVTEMVGEFPELQGLMGGYYARAEGLPDEVADAIRDHYKPVGQGDDVPKAPVTVAVSLADKLDTLLTMFSVNEEPTGSKDPFALRRAALGILDTIVDNGLRLPMVRAIVATGVGYDKANLPDEEDDWRLGALGKFGPELDEDDWVRLSNQLLGERVLGFLGVRFFAQLKANGVRNDYAMAVFGVGIDDFTSMISRADALKSFMDTDDGANLLAGYKRAANIVKKENWLPHDRHPGLDPGQGSSSGAGEQEALSRLGGRDDEGGEVALSYTPEPAEKALIDALDAAEPKAESAVEAEDFAAAMSALASLRAPIDRFFDEVTVNDENEDKRAHRLELLARFRDAVHKVADFSRIEGG